MAIPDFQTLMLPVLRACSDGREHATADLVRSMADQFGLSEAERRQTIPSGGATVIANRTHWAITYMAQAGLLERPRRGFVRLTNRGMELLATRPDRVDNNTLNNYEEFVKFRERARLSASHSGNASTSASPPPDVAAESPEERIRTAALELEASLRSDLLRRIRGTEPRFFERLVVARLVKMGCGSELGGQAEAIGRSGDGGIDGMIDQDPLGLDRVYVQAKRYAEDNPVGSPAILQFSGALAQRGAARGVFITTSRFTEDARATAARLPQRILMIDGEELARLLIRHDVGVRIVETFHVEKIDEDAFLEE